MFPFLSLLKAKKGLSEVCNKYIFCPLMLTDFLRLAWGTQPREGRLSPLVKIKWLDDFIHNFVIRTHSGNLPGAHLQNVLLGGFATPEIAVRSELSERALDSGTDSY